MSLEEIRNFLRIDDRVGTAGQPGEGQLAEIAAAGYVAVLNLGLLDPSYCLTDEAGAAAALGLQYRQIPVRFDAPTIADFKEFVAVMDAWTDRRVMVHCAANYRVSSFVALYGELRWGWSRDAADEHASRFWEPNDVWQQFLARCRSGLLDAPPATSP